MRQIKEQRLITYRIKPDRRFLLALDEIRHFGNPGAIPLPPPRFENGRWLITTEKGATIEFAELHDFASAIANLRAVAEQVLAGVKLETAASAAKLPDAGFDAASLKRNLQEFNGRWHAGQHDAALLAAASETLAHWAFISLDEMEIADSVQAKALAILALAQTANSQPLTEAESMIADRMGYTRHAVDLAGELPADSLWHLYVEHKDKELARASAESAAQDKYLLLRRLAETEQTEAWVNVMRRDFNRTPVPLHAMATVLLADEYFPRRQISASLHNLVLYHLLRDSGQQEENDSPDNISALLDAAGLAVLGTVLKKFDGTLVNNFESLLSAMGRDLNGPFLDRPAFEAFYRGYFFSGLYHYGKHLLKEYNSVEAASRFASLFDKSSQGTAGEFAVWYGDLVAAEQGKSDAAALIKDLDNLPSFGLPPLRYTLEESLQRLSFGAPEIAATATKIWPRADSRLSHRHILANVLKNTLLDLNAGERIYRSLLRDSTNTSAKLIAWMANYAGDTARLFSVVRDAELPADDRAYALSLASSNTTNDADIRQIYEQLHARAPESWAVLSNYADYLQERNDYAGIVRCINIWLELYSRNSGGFDAPQARVALSRALLALNKKQQAWDAIREEISGDYGPVLRQGIQVLSELGKIDQAEQLARHAVERYPANLPSLMDLLEVLWMKGAYTDAANLLQQWTHPISEEDWRWIVGKHFATKFAGHQAEAVKAFDAFMQAGIDQWHLQQVAAAVAERGDNETAFQLQSQLRWNGPGYLEMLVRSYGFLSNAKGADTALEWLRPQVPPQLRNMASMIYFREKRYGLLWDMIPEPEAGDYPEAVWLYRAAASLDHPELAPDRRNALLEHYRMPRDDAYYRLGRYLLNMTNEDDISGQILAAKQVCETAFFLGWRAKADQRYGDAADWFLTSIATGMQQNGEYRWSYDQLYRWNSLNKSLTVLEEKGW